MPPDGKAGRVGLAANQFFAGELGDRQAPFGRDQERVVLLGGQPGHRLEPVREMRRAVFHGPLSHRGGHDIGDRRVEGSTFLDRVADRLVNIFRQPRLHDFVGEHVDAEKSANRRDGPGRSPAGRRPGGDRLDGKVAGTSGLHRRAPVNSSSTSASFRGRGRHARLAGVKSRAFGEPAQTGPDSHPGAESRSRLGRKYIRTTGLVPVPNGPSVGQSIDRSRFLVELGDDRLGIALEVFLAAVAAEVKCPAFGGHLEGLTHRAQMI